MATFHDDYSPRITHPKEDMSLYDSGLFEQAEMRGRTIKFLTDLLVEKTKSRVGATKAPSSLRLSDFDGLTVGDLLSTKWIGPKRLRAIANYFEWDKPITPSLLHAKVRRHRPHRAKAPHGIHRDELSDAVTHAEALVGELVKVQYTVTDEETANRLNDALKSAIDVRRKLAGSGRI